MMVEAEAALNEAMDIDSNNYDTLVNQVVYNQGIVAKGQQLLFVT